MGNDPFRGTAPPSREERHRFVTLVGVHAMRFIAIAAAGVLLGGCGGDSGTQEPPPSKGFSVIVADNMTNGRAERYARAKSKADGGGCPHAVEAQDIENASCVYEAALAGCFEGITGSGFPAPPFRGRIEDIELRTIMRRGMRDCTSGVGDRFSRPAPKIRAQEVQRRATLRDQVGDARPPWDIVRIDAESTPRGYMVSFVYRWPPLPARGDQGLLVSVDLDTGAPSREADFMVDVLRDSAYSRDRTKLLNGDYTGVPCHGLEVSARSRTISMAVPRGCLGRGATQLRVRGYSYLPRGTASTSDYVERWGPSVSAQG